MNHRFKLHPDSTLEITMPKGKKVGRVLVCEAGTQNGTLMYPDCDDCIKHGGDWECDRTHCRKGTKQQATKASDLISRQSAISIVTFECGNWTGLSKEINKQIQNLPSTEPEYKELKDWKTDFKGFIDALDIPRDDYRRIMEYIDEVPFAQTERKKGKWIYNSPVTMKCDQCGLVIKDWDWNRFKYCPNCMAEMRGEQE